jgi:uncharacterized protein
VNEEDGRRKRPPSRQMALKLLSQAGCSESVIEHCKAVAAAATEMAKACRERGLEVDLELVEIGALLHDIGRARTHSVHHARAGVEIAKSLNLPEAVVSIIDRHVGGGITVDEAARIGWEPKSYVPQTLEERLVSYADLTVARSRRIPFDKTIERFSKELPPVSIDAMRKLHEDITALLRDCDADSHAA